MDALASIPGLHKGLKIPALYYVQPKAGRIDSLESILWLLKYLQIPAQAEPDCKVQFLDYIVGQ